jgi:transcriptional accessory protein Tex/SPT6
MDTPLPPEQPVDTAADAQTDTAVAGEAVQPRAGTAVAIAELPPAEGPAEAHRPPAPEPQPLAYIPIDLSRVAQDLQIRKTQVEAVVQLLDEGNTVPFIARYRNERTGGLPEEMIRRVRHRVGRVRHLIDRKHSILKSIASRGKLTDELREEIIAAENPKRLEDLYQPFKPRKRSAGSDAPDKGLEPLALAIWDRDPVAANLDELLPTVVNPEKGLTTVEDIVRGVNQILAELIADRAALRGVLRMVLWDTGRLSVTKSEALTEGKGVEYKDYFQFTESIRHIPPHRVLAINRGEKENALKVRLEFDEALVRGVTADYVPLADHPHKERLVPVVEDAVTRLLLPSLEREIRRDLTERAQDHAIAVFARNLRSLLLQRPLRGQRVLAIDPGFRNGCKIAVIDEAGELLEHATVHPHHPQRKTAEARHKLEELIRTHQPTVVAIGNGTASRDTEELVAELIGEFAARRRGEVVAPSTAASAPAPSLTSEVPAAPADEANAVVVGTEAHSFGFTFTDAATTAPLAGPVADPVSAAVEGFSLTSDGPPPFAAPAAVGPPVAGPAPAPPPPSLDGLPEPPAALAYVIVNEAGAGDYATSPVGREEFPNCDAALRSTVSIGRRLQDPLRELVKIDPQHVGVGLYQHDVHPKHLKDALAEVIESCVNYVGADLNTAGVPLLRHISGLNATAAREMVEHRKRHGPLTSREQLKTLGCLAESQWAQAVGFLKIGGAAEPLDDTWIHPESYSIARQILCEIGTEPEALRRHGADGELPQKLSSLSAEDFARRTNAGHATVRDILVELASPGRDPREDSPPPVFKTAVLRLEDLQPGMELKGTVLNVVPFGAFVDVGLKDSGLVHISQMANRYIKSPHEVVAVGDVVSVWVLNVDSERRRASLTMIAPGTERKPPERRARPERPAGEPRPAPRGRPPRRGPRPGSGPGRRPPSADGAEPPMAEPTVARPPRQLPERKPPKPRPLPNLTQAKKEGKEYLNTLGELAAFFKAREVPGASPDQPPAP